MDRKQSGHTQPLWDRTSKIQDRLREPKSANVSSSAAANHQDRSNLSCSSPQTSNTSSNLNVNAPEFVPAWLKSSPPVMDLEHQFQNVQINVAEMQLPPRTSAQNRLQIIKGPVHNNEHAAQCYVDTSPMMNGCGDEDDSTDFARLKNIIKSLKMYPGQFDDLLEVFMETIFPYFNDIFTMAKIAQLLIGEAVNCPNFHYTGVRLCWYVEHQCPEFRAELHLRCQKEMQENPNQQNVALFIAELYTQLPHGNLYGTLLIESLTRLLSFGGNDNVKCVCQALKLTGFSLEHNNKQDLDELFVKLRSMKHSVSGSALHLLDSVVNLRGTNWGRPLEGTNSESSDYYDQNCEEIVNEILYESDGLIFTSEEQEFLATHASNHDDYIIDNDDPDALYDPEPEMTEEMQADFKEFVKLSKG